MTPPDKTLFTIGEISKAVGVCRYIYLEGPPQRKDKSRFVTQVVLLLKNS